ncbi:hypothetical protein, partial [Nocardioides aquiterrae]|uniref:hypothetical protein n=1 Tax=Nocardioides aquiterrae TaxID=203799 RepID=UPI0031D66EF5
MSENDPSPTRWWQRKQDQPAEPEAPAANVPPPAVRTPADLQAAIERAAELRRRAEQAAAEQAAD